MKRNRQGTDCDVRKGSQHKMSFETIPKMSLLKWLIPGETVIDKAQVSIRAFCDGGCVNNGKKGSQGGLGVVFPDRPDMNLSEKLPSRPPPTNNRAELLAVIRCLQQCEVIDPTHTAQAMIKSDSNLACRTTNEWLKGWKRNNWKKPDGKPPLNLDLLKTLDILISSRRVYMSHVKAHTGRTDFDSIHNDMADRLATQAIRRS